MIFPGYVEIICPFCDRYKDVSQEELAKLNDRLPKGGDDGDVVCDYCWKLVQVFIEMERDKLAKERCERGRIRAQTNVTFKDG